MAFSSGAGVMVFASLSWIGLDAAAAEVRVMISASFCSAFAELAPIFERDSRYKLVTARCQSMGDSPEAIPSLLVHGESANLLILDYCAAHGLHQRGRVRNEPKVDFARSQFGVMVSAGDALPDITSVESFKATLLAARSIAYSDSGNGTYLSTTLFARSGVADRVEVQTRKLRWPT